MEKAFCFYKNRPCMGYRRKLSNESFELNYTWVTFKQFHDLCQQLGNGLKNYLGLKSRSFVGIASLNRIEWFVADFGCVMKGMVVIPIHHYLSEDSIVEIINTTNLECIFCSLDVSEKFVSVKEKCPSLRNVVTFPDQTDGSFENLMETDFISHQEKLESNKQEIEKPPFLVNFDTIMKRGVLSFLNKEIVRLDSEEIFTIIFSSGSTGSMKGAVFTDNLMRLTTAYQLRTFFDPLVQISKDSLAHISVPTISPYFKKFLLNEKKYRIEKLYSRLSSREEELEWLQMV